MRARVPDRQLLFGKRDLRLATGQDMALAVDKCLRLLLVTKLVKFCSASSRKVSPCLTLPNNKFHFSFSIENHKYSP